MESTSSSLEMSLWKFDGTNFNYWKDQMQDYFIMRGQIDPIKNVVAPAGTKPEEWKLLDRTTRAMIRMHLSKSVYCTV